MTSRTGTDFRRRAEAGFTLIETLVVLTLIAIVSAALLPRIVAGLRGATPDDVANDIVLAMRETQGLALASGEPAVLEVDVDAHSLQLPGAKGRVIDVPRAWEMRLVTARREVSGAGTGGLRFFPDGSSTGGRIELRDGERSVLVDVTWLTGRITVSDPED